jgi:hypothetical protein
MGTPVDMRQDHGAITIKDLSAEKLAETEMILCYSFTKAVDKKVLCNHVHSDLLIAGSLSKAHVIHDGEGHGTSIAVHPFGSGRSVVCYKTVSSNTEYKDACADVRILRSTCKLGAKFELAHTSKATSWLGVTSITNQPKVLACYGQTGSGGCDLLAIGDQASDCTQYCSDPNAGSCSASWTWTTTTPTTTTPTTTAGMTHNHGTGTTNGHGNGQGHAHLHWTGKYTTTGKVSGTGAGGVNNSAVTQDPQIMALAVASKSVMHNPRTELCISLCIGVFFILA